MKKTIIPLLLAGGFFIVPSVSEAGWLDNFRKGMEQRRERREQRRERRRQRLERLNDLREHRNQQREKRSVPELDASSSEVVGALLFGSILLFTSRRKK